MRLRFLLIGYSVFLSTAVSALTISGEVADDSKVSATGIICTLVADYIYDANSSGFSVTLWSIAHFKYTPSVKNSRIVVCCKPHSVTSKESCEG